MFLLFESQVVLSFIKQEVTKILGSLNDLCLVDLRELYLILLELSLLLFLSQLSSTSFQL